MKESLSKFEVSVAVLSGVIVFVATLTGPRLSHGFSHDTLAVTNARQERQIADLEAALAAAREQGVTLQDQLADAGGQLETLRSELATLKQERETLATQLAAATKRVQQVEGKLRTTDEEAAKLKELLSVQEANKERDEAKARAEKAEERIRELTLELHRSGVWP